MYNVASSDFLFFFQGIVSNFANADGGNVVGL